MKLFTIISLIVGLCALLQDSEARRMGGGGKHVDEPEPPQEDAPGQPFRFRRALTQMSGFAQAPPPPEEVPEQQNVEDAPEPPFRARRSVKMADEPEPPSQMEEVPDQPFRARRQAPGMLDRPDMPPIPEMPDMPGPN